MGNQSQPKNLLTVLLFVDRVVVPFSGEPRRHYSAPFLPKLVQFESCHIPLTQIIKTLAQNRPCYSPSSSKVVTASCPLIQFLLSKNLVNRRLYFPLSESRILLNPAQQHIGSGPVSHPGGPECFE
jgi:hypothetical protein